MNPITTTTTEDLSRPSPDRTTGLLQLLQLACGVSSETAEVDSPPRYTAFHSRSEPSISLARFVMRLWQRTRYGRPVISFAIVLMCRYWQLPGRAPSQLCAHRLALAAFVVASKVHEERVFDNAVIASAAGVTPEELNRLEAALLDALSYRVHVSAADIEATMGPLVAAAASATPVEAVCAHLGVRKRPPPAAGDDEDEPLIIFVHPSEPHSPCSSLRRCASSTVSRQSDYVAARGSGFSAVMHLQRTAS